MNFIAAAASALILALALPNELAPYGIAPLGFICLAPYFAAIARSRSYREAAALGAVFGSLSHAASSYWLYFFKDFAIWTIGSTSVAYGLLHMLIAAFLRRFSVPVRHGIRAPGYDYAELLRPFLVALVWTVWERQKSVGFLGYPWGLVAYALNDRPRMIQIADALGVYGLSFLLALSSAVLAELFRCAGTLRRIFSARRGASSGTEAATVGAAASAVLRAFRELPALRSALVAASVFLWFALYGALALARPTPTVDRVPMLLVQHNADAWIQGEAASLKTVVRLTREGLDNYGEGKKPALIAWSETVLRRPFEEYRPYFRKNPPQDPLIPLLEEAGVPLLTGAPVILDWDTYDATNSAILIQSDSSVPYSYAKRQPVPFAEAIPFWEYAWMRTFMREVVGLDGGWTMGTEIVVMEIPTPSGRPLKFGVPICFEDAFAAVCADFFREGADILINITNDSWSRTVSAETQHFAAARFRSVENRRVMVRATNGGVTAVVDAEGRMTASLPLFTEAYLAAEVPVQAASRPTTYFLLGDWFPLLAAAVLFLVLAAEAAAGVASAPRRCRRRSAA